MAKENVLISASGMFPTCPLSGQLFKKGSFFGKYIATRETKDKQETFLILFVGLDEVPLLISLNDADLLSKSQVQIACVYSSFQQTLSECGVPVHSNLTGLTIYIPHDLMNVLIDARKDLDIPNKKLFNKDVIEDRERKLRKQTLTTVITNSLKSISKTEAQRLARPENCEKYAFITEFKMTDGNLVYMAFENPNDFDKFGEDNENTIEDFRHLFNIIGLPNEY